MSFTKVPRTPRGMGFLLCLALLAAIPAHPGDLDAGAAKTIITPDDATRHISVMGVLHEGVDHDLYARALVLNDGETRLVIVTYDLNCLDVATPILRVRCRDELGVDPACLILLGTHNHQAPIQIVPDNFDYGRWLADRIFLLIEQAIANEQGPVRLLFGAGQGDFVTALGASVVDKEVQLLKVVRGQKTVALLFNHPTHPLWAKSNNIDVAHCGYAVDEVERRLPGTLALYADACGGNQFAGLPRGLDAVKALGNRFADVVMGIADGPMQDVTGPISATLDTISLPLAPPIPLEQARKLATLTKAPLDIGCVPYPHPDRETNWIRVLLEYYAKNKPFPKRTTDLVCTDDAFLVEQLPEPREFPCVFEETIVARIGPMVLVAMQGEVCAPIGMRIKDAFREEHPIMVFAYMGEHNLYIPTRKIVKLRLYQAKVIQTQYACPVAWAPEVEDEMAEGVVDLVKACLEKSKTGIEASEPDRD